jgi:hypothetical protein
MTCGMMSLGAAEVLEKMNVLMEADGNLRLPDDYTNRVLTDMVRRRQFAPLGSAATDTSLSHAHNHNHTIQHTQAYTGTHTRQCPCFSNAIWYLSLPLSLSLPPSLPLSVFHIHTYTMRSS